MALSQYLATAQLNWLRNTAMPTALGTLYISIHTGDPGNSGTQSDVTVSVASARASWNTVSDSSAPAAAPSSGYRFSNTATILLTNNAGAAATLTHFGLWDAVSGGNFLVAGLLDQVAAIEPGDTVQFNADALRVRFV